MMKSFNSKVASEASEACSGIASAQLYDADPKSRCALYESVAFDEIHKGILDLLPEPPARILDVGAGSGRDAAALARKGFHVVAVEPSSGMRTEAARLHPDNTIEWVDESLPTLRTIKNRGDRYSVILVSAVWMHIPPDERREAFETLTAFTQEGGILVLTLRLGPTNRAEHIYQVAEDELLELAKKYPMRLVRTTASSDRFQRSKITWKTVVFRKK